MTYDPFIDKDNKILTIYKQSETKKKTHKCGPTFCVTFCSPNRSKAMGKVYL